MKNKERFMWYVEIAKRAEALGVARGDRFTSLMDLEHADDQFELRLEDFYKADDLNFIHDFCGIQSSINRETGIIEKFFVPRFAKL